MRHLSVFVSLFVTINCGYASSDMAAAIERQAERFKVPGVSVAIIDNGEVSYLSHGLAVAGTSQRVDSRTLFHMASISKPVTAWGVMHVMQQRGLGADTPLVEHVHSWQLPDSRFDHTQVTLGRVLSHSAGLSASAYQGFPDSTTPPTLEQSLNGVPLYSSAVRLKHSPGDGFHYSGGGYSLLQLFIQDTTGTQFGDYMTQQVLRPLGMTTATYNRSTHENKAMPHGFDGLPVENYWLVELAAGGLQASAEDMAQFALANMGQNALLKESTRTQMHAPVVEVKDGLSMTMGFEWRNGLLSHGGHNRGYVSSLDIDPESQKALIILTNSEAGRNIINPIRCIWSEQFGVKGLTDHCEDYEAGIARSERISLWTTIVLSLLTLALLATFYSDWRRQKSLAVAGRFRITLSLACLGLLAAVWVLLLTDLGIYLVAGVRWGFATINYLNPTPWNAFWALTPFGLVAAARLLLSPKLDR